MAMLETEAASMALGIRGIDTTSTLARSSR